MFFFLAVALALLPGASTIPWAGPDITNKPHPAHEGWSPATTGLVGAIGKGYELFKRQGISTCGYISGTSSRPVTCRVDGDVCVTNTFNGVFGCCPGTDIIDCLLATACVPYASLGYCNAACRSDNYITRCGSAAPYCQYDIFVFPDTEFTYFGCAIAGTVVTVYPTYNGGSVTVTYAPFTATTTLTTTATPPPTITSSAPPASLSTTTTPTPTPTPTPMPTPTPAGAIAGGVVGGIAVLAALGFGIFYLLTRRRRENASGASGFARDGPAGGPPPVDPKPPINSSVGPAGNGVAGVGAGAAIASTMGGAQAEYYTQPNAAGALPEMTVPVPTVSPTPYQPLHPQRHIGYTPEGMPTSGLVPQGQPMSPAPPYTPDASQMRATPAHRGSVPPPMGDANMIDGRQVWPTGPGVYEAPGSVPGQPLGINMGEMRR
ncbi:uncharacterized protein K441DRAFT_700303 [Cenococcum geophilum 1.58]|uniref:uncharacterized protein n=1 Tax=Cenococcum geophilum 1.58 TaxID=794803 RepID=UPI00358F9CF9|nr:hypothetical protein K441DRAFT_700303 [Cenococcum geophilum 1.58]